MHTTPAPCPLAGTTTFGISLVARWLTLGVAVLVSVESPAAAQAPPILNVPILRHTPSIGRAFTSTRDGKWLYHSEGGTMVFIKANATDTNILDSDYEAADGVKRVGIGNSEVLVARMILDPDADLEPGPNTGSPNKNLLYMACGRDGLWIMEADVGLGVTNKAWRVDDKGDIQTSITRQKSRRWCADVEICNVDGIAYLVAVFAKKGHSFLRVYPLSQVRAIASTSTELLNEIIPERQVTLSGNASAPTNASPVNFSQPIAIALAVDQETEPGEGGAEYAEIFVAMGPHGVVRVTLKGDGLGNLLEPTKTDGPVFGSGSAYDINSPVNLVPSAPDATAGLYGNLTMETNWKFIPTQLERTEEAPLFVDLVVFDGVEEDQETKVHQLFVAVDHLFWVVFDLEQTFSPQMPILHHEGERWSFESSYFTNAQQVVKPLSGPDEVSFARALQVVDTGSQEGPLLVVTGSRFSLMRDFGHMTLEAVGFDEHLSPGRTWTKIPGQERTYVYKIQKTYPNADFNAEASFDEGGGEVIVPPTQDGLTQSSPYLAVFHSYLFDDSSGPPHLPAVSLTRVTTPLPSTTSTTYKGPVDNHRGRMAFNIGHSILDPNLLLTSGNDAGLPQDGIAVMGRNPASTNDEVKIYDQGGPATDSRGSGGILADADMQWIDPADSEAEFWWTSGVHTDPITGDPTSGFKLIHIELPGGDAFSTDPLKQPNQDWVGYIQPPKNSFGGRGRVYYQAGCMNRDFETFLGAGESRLFGTWHKSPEGLVVLDGDKVVSLLSAAQGTVIDSDGWPDTEMRLLVTHPEFNKMPRTTGTLRQFWQDTLSGNKDLITQVGAWPSKLLELPGGSWVLAVPCGQISANPDWDIYDVNGNWRPLLGSIWETEYTHGLVQFWEMKPDPDDNNRYWPATADPSLADGIEGVSPLKKIVIPDANTVIGTLESITMTHNNSQEMFLFCADFGGNLYVYSITDIATSMGIDDAVDSSKLVATWSSKKNLFDDQPSLIFDISIDYRGGGSEVANVYVTSPRVGVQVLEFTVPSASATEPTLVFKEIIQSSGWTTGVDVRVNTDLSRHLLVSENWGGFRVFEKETP